MSTGNHHRDPDNIFSDTRMSFGDHLEELRVHLWRAVAGFGVAMVFSLFIGKPVLEFIAKPVEQQLESFYERRTKKILAGLESDPELQRVNQPTGFVQLAFLRDQITAVMQGKPVEPTARPRLKQPEVAQKSEPGWMSRFLFGGTRKEEVNPSSDGPEVSPSDLVYLWVAHAEPLREAGFMKEAHGLLGKRFALTTLSVQEAFMVYFKVSMVCGLVIGSPWIFYQIWAFVAAGLYPHEKRYVHVYLPFSLGLFLLGVFTCEFFVIPRAIEALLWFNEWLGMEPDLRLNEWLGFAILMPLVFGVSFQTPLVMLFLERIGIMDVESYQKRRRMAWFIMAIFAAVITPSTDAISMLFLWLPMSLLFELGIVMCKMSPRQPDFGLEMPDSEEMVEV